MSIEKIKAVSDQILNRLPAVLGKGEQATKQSLVLPMIDALGFDIWNPSEVCPEYEADFAIKKQGQKEKVDIAVLIGSVPRMYIEVKPAEVTLDDHEGQLARYFNATPSVTLGVLTNGIEWRFFTDTGDPNVMDSKPFHVVNLNAADQGLEVLIRFAKDVFCPEAIRDYATDLKYTASVASFLRTELDLRDKDPSEYFIRWLLKSDGMYNGVVNANVIDRFRPITKTALTRVVREIVRRSISAMEQEAAQNTQQSVASSEPAPVPVRPQEAIQPNSGSVDTAQEDLADGEGKKIVTSEQELESFAIIKEIFAKSPLAQSTVFDPAKRRQEPPCIAYKDTTGYFGIYLNKPGWWAMRIVLEAKTPWIGFDLPESVGRPLLPPGAQQLQPTPWAQFRVAIKTPQDIRGLDRIVLATIGAVISSHSSGAKTDAG